MKRFWNKVEKTDTCWIWKAGGRGNGYGCFKYKKKNIDTHRMVWFLTYGKFSDKLICHKCNIRKCVNPEHLYEGTSKENVRDAIVLGTFHKVKTPNGEKNPRHKLSNKEVKEIRLKYKKGIYGARRLAKEYNVKSHYTIQCIINNKTRNLSG